MRRFIGFVLSAILTWACREDALPEPPVDPHFTDVTDETVFLQFETFPPPYQPGDLPLNPYPSPSFGDWDSDGDLDLPGYRNDEGTFVDVLDGSGIQVLGHYRGSSWGDYDADGDLDLMVLAYVYGEGPDMLYRNDGNGTFTEVGAEFGMDRRGFGETASWGDYDGDQDLDLLIGSYECGGLWRNDGPDGFVDVLSESGIDMRVAEMRLADGSCVEIEPECGAIMGTTKPESSTFFDYDDDGWLDVFVAARLWRNRGDSTFEDVTEAEGGFMSYPLCQAHDEGFSPVDADDDGDLDISVFYEWRDQLFVFERNGDCGLGYCPHDMTGTTVAAALATKWTDVDNDGDLDMYTDAYGYATGDVPDDVPRWFLNDGSFEFREVRSWRFDTEGEILGFPSLFGSFGDYDSDGDIDYATWNYESDANGFGIVRYRILRNDLAAAGGWLRVRVLDDNGRYTEFGSVIRLREPGESRIQTRYVDGGTNWSVDAYDVHFAVDDASTYELWVTFPRHAGEEKRVVDVEENPLLRFSPQELGGRVLEVRRDGTVAVH